MTTILVDHNLVGTAPLLYGTIQTLGWIELLQLEFVNFQEVGLDIDVSDRIVWRYAQAHGMILLTGNRNNKLSRRWTRLYPVAGSG